MPLYIKARTYIHDIRRTDYCIGLVHLCKLAEMAALQCTDGTIICAIYIYIYICMCVCSVCLYIHICKYEKHIYAINADNDVPQHISCVSLGARGGRDGTCCALVLYCKT